MNPLMKNELIVIRLFLAAIAAASLAFSPFVLDVTLVPRFFLCAVFLLPAVYLLYKERMVQLVNADLIITAYFAYTVCDAASFFWAQNKAEAAFEISKQVLSFLVFVFTYFALKKQEAYTTNRLLKLSAIIFMIAFAAGAWQVSKLASWNKDALYAVTGINGHKNLFSSFLLLNLFFLFTAFRRLSGAWKGVALLCAFLNVAAILILNTKAVWFGAGAGLIIYLLLHLHFEKEKPPPVISFAGVVRLLVIANVFFLFLLPPLIKKGITLLSPSAAEIKPVLLSDESERLVLWDKSFQMINDHPLFGVGAGNWQVHFPNATLSGLYRAEDLNYTFQRPHNDFLWVLCETGIIGFNLLLLFLISLIVLLIKAARLSPEGMRYDLALTAAFIMAYFIASFFDFPRERAEHLVWINSMLGMGYFQLKKQVPVYSFGNIAVKKPAYNFLLLVLSLIAMLTLLRYKGEYYMRKLYTYRNSNQTLKVLEAGKAAWSILYTLDPTSVPVKWFTANANASTGNYVDAHKDFLSAYEANPYNRNVLNDLASSYAFNKNTAIAKKYYEEASRISPRFDDPKLNLTALYIGEKNYAAATACLNSLLHDSERRSNYQKIIELQSGASTGSATPSGD